MSAVRNSVKMERVADTYMNALITNAESMATVPFVKLKNNPDAFSDVPLLAEQELLSIYAVLAHIAFNRDINQEALLTLVEAEFSVDHIRKIPQTHFHSVMEFLIDLRMEGLRSGR